MPECGLLPWKSTSFNLTGYTYLSADEATTALAALQKIKVKALPASQSQKNEVTPTKDH